MATGLEIAAALWLADKATGGIVSEYGKRFWFGKIHKQRDEAEKLRKELQAVVQHFAETEALVPQLLEQKAELEEEIKRLRRENASLRKEKPSGPASPDGKLSGALPPAA
jgi:predicted RNase H-like nuclease (RuvC/YqgF family)